MLYEFPVKIISHKKQKITVHAIAKSCSEFLTSNSHYKHILITYMFIINKFIYLLTNIFLHDYLCFTDEKQKNKRG